MPGWPLPYDTFASVYTNRTDRTLSVRLKALRAGPGSVFAGDFTISRSERPIDIITTASYTVPSETIWLQPGESIYGAYDVGPANPEAGLAVLIFDPDVILRNLGSRGNRIQELLKIRLMTSRRNLPVTSIGPTLSLNNYFSPGWA